ncbi:globin family protein [Nibrella saemangeumensis]|uniref:Globin family protein n=1 Tax=Nibrella saemangeumensis TaxID=1084526 RepID=A0ABP8NEX1_9BACT
MMTEEQIVLVKKTWRLLRDVDPVLVGNVFYSRLFLIDPSLRSLFKSPMEAQYTKLMATLSLIVARLDRLDQLTADIAALAQRHAGYGVKPQHYETVGKALLWMLQQGLGRDWNPTVEEAWKQCYTLLSQTMLQSLNPSQSVRT